jgi:glycosyltransferase involved in cell wall biosynthesis
MGFGTFIALATHNGAKYIDGQLESLLGQTVSDWTLLIRDDASTDDTPDIIRAYAGRDPRIRELERHGSSTPSAKQAFARLLEAARGMGADVVFCCDQDDVWAPDKLEKVLERLQGIKGPALVHHDLQVVDQGLEPISESFWELMHLKPGDQARPQRLLSRNEVTGCALAVNRALLEIALPIPREAIMHDWWLALFAAYFGELTAMPDRLVKYRQHEANVIGAKSFWHGLNPFNNWGQGWKAGNREFLETVAQARSFRTAVRDRLDFEPGQASILDGYCELPRAGRRQRLAALKGCGLWRDQWLLDTVLTLRLLLLPREKK